MSTDSAEVHIGDIGTELRLVVSDQDDSVVDLSAATDTLFIITKPNGTILEITADLYTDGTDGTLTYSTIDGDLSVAGLYKIQARIVFTSGSYSSSIQTFRVYNNLN